MQQKNTVVHLFLISFQTNNAGNFIAISQMEKIISLMLILCHEKLFKEIIVIY